MCEFALRVSEDKVVQNIIIKLFDDFRKSSNFDNFKDVENCFSDIEDIFQQDVDNAVNDQNKSFSKSQFLSAAMEKLHLHTPREASSK